MDHESFHEEFLSRPSGFRLFELTVENRSMFVNAHHLADISPYFAALCFNGFREKEEQWAAIEGETFEAMLELFSCILPTDTHPPRAITVDNFAIVARLADKFQMKPLSQACEMFVESKLFDITHINEPQLLAMLRAVVEYRLAKSVLIKLLERAAVIPLVKLMEHNVQNWLPGNASAALFRSVIENDRQDQASIATNRKHYTSVIRANGRVTRHGDCSFCGRPYAVYYCEYCELLFCSVHNGAGAFCDKAPQTATPAIAKCRVGHIDVRLLD